MRRADRALGDGPLRHDGTPQPILCLHPKGLRSKSGVTLVPIGGALERIPRTDESRFVEVAADELEGDGTAVWSEAPGKRDRRATGHVEGTGKAEQSGDQRGVFAKRRHLCERGCRESLGRDRDEIDLLEHKSQRSAKRLAPQHDLLVVRAGLLKTKIEQSCKPGPIFGLPQGIRLLVRDGCLDAAKWEPVIDYRLGIRKRNLTDRRTQIR